MLYPTQQTLIARLGTTQRSHLTMRGRVTPLRNLTNVSPVGRRSFIDFKGNKPKALERHEDEDGNTFYTVSRWGEGRGAPDPRSRGAQKEFLISNLLLDLDAYGRDDVREFSTEDEARMLEEIETTGRRGKVDDKLRELVKTLNQSRWNSEKLVLNPAHPKRITNGDIMSAALRPPADLVTVHLPSKRGNMVSNQQRRNQQPRSEGEETEETYDIEELDHFRRHQERNDMPGKFAKLRHSASAGPEPSGERIRMLRWADSSRTEFADQVREANGVPQDSENNDEQVLRWMLLRQYNSAFVAARSPGLEPGDIMAAIRDVEEQHCNFQEGTKSQDVERKDAQNSVSYAISSLRRIVFHALTSTPKLMSVGSRDESLDQVAAQIRTSARAILKGNYIKKDHYFAAMTFANNLSTRPEIQGNHGMTLTVCALRLQAAAGLRDLELMSSYLDQGMISQALNNGGHLLEEVDAALRFLESYVRPNETEIMMMLRILTGHGTAAPSKGDSLRDTIIHQVLCKSTPEHKVQSLAIYGRYVALLGRLGCLRLLWSEWQTAQAMLSKTPAEGGSKTSSSLRRNLVKKFQSALDNAQHTSQWPDTMGASTFDDCARLDYESISQSKQTSQRERRDIWAHLSDSDFEKMMNLPCDQWLDGMKRVAKEVSEKDG